MSHTLSIDTAGAFRPESTRGLGLLRRRWDFAAVLLLVIATVPPTLVARKHMDMIVTANLDDSWFVDSSYKATRGIWLGGPSVVFTYGPMMQWLFSAPARWTGYSMGKVYNTYAVFPMWLALVLGAFAVQLLLPEQPAWKRFVLLIFLAVFWAAPDGGPTDLRPYTVIFIFVVYLKGWYAVRHERLNPVLFGACGALLALIAFLVTADTGAQTLAAFFIAFAGIACEHRRRGFSRRGAAVLGSFSVAFAALVLLLNAVTRRLLDFTFWKVMLALVTSYRWFEAFAMDKPSKVHVIAAVAASLVVFGTRRLLPRNEETFTARRGFLIAVFLFSFLYLQVALVRSDGLHVQIGMFATVFFLGVVFFGFPPATAWSTVGVLFAVVLSWFLSPPNPTFLATEIQKRYEYMLHPRAECPLGWEDVDRVCFPYEYAKSLKDAKAYVQQRTTPEQSIFVFPWNNIFGSITRRDVAGGLLQSYLAGDSYLNSVHVGAIERAMPTLGLYFDEGWGWPVDKVPNFTRNPDFWFWIWSHYRSDQMLPSGILGLRLDPGRSSRVRKQSVPLQLQSRDFRITRRTSTIDLGSVDWPQGADLLHLRLNVHYPLWWKLRKPSEIHLQILHADGSSKLVKFVVPPNTSVDTWFYPWDAPLVGFFSEDEAKWHEGNRPKVTGLRFFVSPIDWVSVIPKSISLEAVDAVSLSLAPLQTASRLDIGRERQGSSAYLPQPTSSLP